MVQLTLVEHRQTFMIRATRWTGETRAWGEGIRRCEMPVTHLTNDRTIQMVVTERLIALLAKPRPNRPRCLQGTMHPDLQLWCIDRRPCMQTTITRTTVIHMTQIRLDREQTAQKAIPRFISKTMGRTQMHHHLSSLHHCFKRENLSNIRLQVHRTTMTTLPRLPCPMSPPIHQPTGLDDQFMAMSGGLVKGSYCLRLDVCRYLYVCII
ncbi:MAG: hypothetical protein J3Q66DRAFT_42790 [Benniella sp.]|nr:MAG: hypothetical protein J3Q66DRAFT_42790 [Benniella sp.]